MAKKMGRQGVEMLPQKDTQYIYPRMYNPVWINPDGFRWIEVLKREDKMERYFQSFAYLV